MRNERHSASFRDPSGFIFTRGDVIYRQVNQSYRQHYDHFVASGLYEELLQKEIILPHEEVDVPAADATKAYRIIRPEQLAFVSYPYEWSFSMLKDAALTTLRLETLAMKHSMTLKDASAYNIQFHHGRPTLIDSLSFEFYEDGATWDAYRQFCQHFLAPLALMAHVDIRFGQYSQVHIDGIPLDLASKLLPRRTMLNVDLLTHLHLHSRSQKRAKDQEMDADHLKKRRISKTGRRGLIDSLKNAVQRMKLNQSGDWAAYYAFHNYDDAAFLEKKEVVARFLDETQPGYVVDLGANTGVFSEMASKRDMMTIALDVDPAAVEIAYLRSRKRNDQRFLPLRMDLTNPSPGLGWGHQERESLANRSPDEVIFALALVHHLAIGNNVPLVEVARYFASLGRSALVEFVPKRDSQVQKMLASRLDIFPDYHQQGFEEAFARFFRIRWKHDLKTSARILYALDRR